MLEEVLRRYDDALSDCNSDIRTHIPTLLEYARRVGSVAEMGVHRGFSSLAFLRAALEATLQRGTSFRYRMYDIQRTRGVDMASNLMESCSHGVDFAFREGDVLDEGMLNGSLMEAPELLFIDTTHTYEQLLQELKAFGPMAERYIILHDTETFGDVDNAFVHDEGTLRSYNRRKQRVQDEQRRQLLSLPEASVDALAPEKVLEVLASAEAAVLRETKTGLRAAVEDWLGEPSVQSEWVILEHSPADNGLTVLGKRSSLAAGLARPAPKNATTWCSSPQGGQALAEASSLAKGLTYYDVNFPGMFGGTVLVNRTVAKALHTKLVESLRRCPAHAGAQAALRILPEHFQRGRRKSSPASASNGPLHLRAKTHPDTFLFALSKQQATLQHYEDAVTWWPHRLESWLGLAMALGTTDRSRTAHAWRRVLALRGRNRHVAEMAVRGLQQVGLTGEAALDWDDLSRGMLWDDPRRHPAGTWRQSVTTGAAAFPEETHGVLRAHKEFALAKDILKGRWELIREELLEMLRTKKASQLNGFCKESGWCEYIMLSYEGCMFISECVLVPSVCIAVREMEATGLRVARAALSVVGSWESTESSVHILPHGSPKQGRLRLSCTIFASEGTTSTMYIAGEEPRVYKEGKCFWFDESFTHEVLHKTQGSERLRATFYVDALHPGYYPEGTHVVEVGHRPSSLGAWQAFVASALEDETAGGIGLLRPGQELHTYTVSAPDPRPWVELAAHLEQEHADTCIIGDRGALFHRTAFQWSPGRPGKFMAVAILLGIFRRMEGFLHNAATLEKAVHGGLEAVLSRLRRVTLLDLEVLRDSLWGCMALGCKHCPSMEVSGLCIPGLPEGMRMEMLESFARMMRIDPTRFTRWFRLLGFKVPPPLGWGFQPQAFSEFVETHDKEITEFSEGWP